MTLRVFIRGAVKWIARLKPPFESRPKITSEMIAKIQNDLGLWSAEEDRLFYEFWGKHRHEFPVKMAYWTEVDKVAGLGFSSPYMDDKWRSEFYRYCADNWSASVPYKAEK